MKLSVLELSDSQRNEYEAFLARPEHREHAMFFHTWEWGEFLAETARGFVRVGIYDGKKLVATAQAALQPLRVGVYWYVPRGMVVDYSHKNLVKEAHCALAAYFKGRSGAAFLRVDPNIVEGSDAVAGIDDAKPKQATLFVQAQHVWIAEVQNTLDEQFEWLKNHGMRKSLAYDYRRCTREGVTMRVSDNPKDLQIFVKLLNRLDERKGGIGKREDVYYEKQFKHLAPAGYEKIFIAEKGDKILAVALMSIYGVEVSYLHAASSDEERHLGGSRYLHFEIMKYLAEHHPQVKRYNFWGVVSDKNRSPDNPHNGYSEFKRSFGGYIVDYIRPRDFVYKLHEWALAQGIDAYRRKKSKKD